MADKKISALTATTTPLAGTEVLPIVQSSATVKVSVANLTAGRAVSASSFTASGDVATTGDQFFYSSNGGGVAAGHLYSGSTGKVQAWVGTNAITETNGNDFKNLVGNFIPNVAGKGINFTANTPAAGMTSQLLNWYEEGTWTPAGNGITFSAASGTYTRIGRLVTASFTVTFPVTANASNAQATGLPFTAGANSAVALSGYNSDLNAQVNSATSLVYFANASGTAYKTNANLSTQIITGTVSYRV